jgi:hypothetical protein
MTNRCLAGKKRSDKCEPTIRWAGLTAASMAEELARQAASELSKGPPRHPPYVGRHPSLLGGEFIYTNNPCRYFIGNESE